MIIAKIKFLPFPRVLTQTKVLLVSHTSNIRLLLKTQNFLPRNQPCWLHGKRQRSFLRMQRCPQKISRYYPEYASKAPHGLTVVQT